MHFHALVSAEKQARDTRKHLWKDYVEPTNSEETDVGGSSELQGEAPQSDKTQSSEKSTPLQEACVTYPCCVQSVVECCKGTYCEVHVMLGYEIIKADCKFVCYFMQVIVTEITSACHFWVQLVDQGKCAFVPLKVMPCFAIFSLPRSHYVMCVITLCLQVL